MSLLKHRFSTQVFFIVELPIKLNDQEINKVKCEISNFSMNVAEEEID